MFVCAGKEESFPFAMPMGIGLEEMAINLTKFLATRKEVPKHLLFVGTAGSYGRSTIFDIVESKTASQIELSFLQKQSYTPINNVVSTGEGQTIVNSSNYITTNFELSKKFLNLNIDIENMEFFAFLQVAKSFGIPAGGVFVVTNFTNQNAHQDFKFNHQEAMRRITRYVENRFQFKI